MAVKQQVLFNGKPVQSKPEHPVLLGRAPMAVGKPIQAKPEHPVLLARAPEAVWKPGQPLASTLFGDKKRGRWEDRYQKIKVLGQGAFGTAILVKSKSGGEERVVKEVLFKPDMPREMILQEIHNMQSLDHPNVLKIFEYFDSNCKLCMVIEPCFGGELHKVIADNVQKGRSLPEHFIRDVMQQSLEAMAYCHEKHLIHKDLKDENIMLLKKVDIAVGQRPHCVIIDLGIAEMFKPANPRGRFLGGTPTTMAPEVFCNHFGPKCDVFSLGCVLFQMLCGKLPCDPNSAELYPRFARCRSQDDQMAVYLEAKKQGPNWQLLDGASKDAQQLARKMMTVTEAQRPSCKQSLKERWLKAGPVSAFGCAPYKMRPVARYTDLSAFQRALMVKAAAKLSTGETEELATVFRANDDNNDGFLEQVELRHAFRKMGMDFFMAAETARALTVEHGGRVEYSDFVAACMSTLGFWREKGLQQAWREFDKENKSWVWAADLERRLRTSPDLVPLDADTHKIISDLDPTKTGRVTFAAFTEYFPQQKTQHEDDQNDPNDSAFHRVRTFFKRDRNIVETDRTAPNVTNQAVKGLERNASDVIKQFVKGDEIEMWSSSKQAWLKGRVEEVFPKAFILGGVYYPNGAAYITTDAGSKWLGPEHSEFFRKPKQSAGEGKRSSLIKRIMGK